MGANIGHRLRITPGVLGIAGNARIMDPLPILFPAMPFPLQETGGGHQRKSDRSLAPLYRTAWQRPRYPDGASPEPGQEQRRKQPAVQVLKTGNRSRIQDKDRI